MVGLAVLDFFLSEDHPDLKLALEFLMPLALLTLGDVLERFNHVSLGLGRTVQHFMLVHLVLGVHTHHCTRYFVLSLALSLLLLLFFHERLRLLLDVIFGFVWIRLDVSLSKFDRLQHFGLKILDFFLFLLFLLLLLLVNNILAQWRVLQPTYLAVLEISAHVSCVMLEILEVSLLTLVNLNCVLH